MFQLDLTDTAQAQLDALDKSPADAGRAKQIKKALGYLSLDPHHPSLETHKFALVPNPIDPLKPVFVAYAQNNTPSAARIIWCYGQTQGRITVILIIPHP